jgi:hypothetical protein
MLEHKVKKFFGRLLHFGFAGGVICAGGYAVIVLIEQGLTWLQSGKLLPASIAGWLRSGFGITDLKTETVGLQQNYRLVLRLTCCVFDDGNCRYLYMGLEVGLQAR